MSEPKDQANPHPTMLQSGPGSSADPGAGQMEKTLEVSHPGVEEDYVSLLTTSHNNYQFVAEIARGGMGRIVAARDRRLHRPVAIKEMLRRGRNYEKRFEREVFITARLQHPSIVSVYEAGRWTTGEAFFAMKHVAGRSLEVVIAESKTLAARLALLPRVFSAADALGYAHGQGVIHRDLKPANVLIGEFGETVVIDWGLAKELPRPGEAAEPDVPMAWRYEDLTVAGTVVGTPTYMAPEQARGLPVDATADVYSLGAMLYHVLSGRRPYTGKDPSDILRKVASAPPEPLARVARGAPAELVAIVEKAMAREPMHRYPSARELAAELSRYQTGQMVAAYDYTAADRCFRWISRHRVVVAAGLTALLALLVAALILGRPWNR